MALLLEPLRERASRAVFHDQVDLLVFIKDAEQLHDVRVVHAQVDVHLAPQVPQRSLRQAFLIQRLDGHLALRLLSGTSQPHVAAHALAH